jgi:hypothetical protein
MHVFGKAAHLLKTMPGEGRGQGRLLSGRGRLNAGFGTGWNIVDHKASTLKQGLSQLRFTIPVILAGLFWSRG